MKELLNRIIYRSQEMNLIVNLPKELELLDYMFVGKVDNKVEEETYEFAMIFETNLDKIDAILCEAKPHFNEDSVFWLCYPSRDGNVRGNVNPKRLNEIATEAGFVQFTNIAVNENWDAMRLKLAKQK